MVTYDYRDLDTGEGMDEPAGSYSAVALHHEHLVRYVMTAGSTVIILRHLPLRMARIIQDVQYSIFPKRRKLEADYERIRTRDMKSLSDAEIGDLLRLDRELAMTDMTALGVVVSPELSCMDDYEELYESLSETDRLKLVTAVRILASARDPREVDSTAENIALKAGIRLMTPEEIELMTVSQASYQVSRILKESRAIEAQTGVRRVRRRPTNGNPKPRT